ncbi:hypothetical protein GCM10020370_62880 [Paenibacillus hodogayensis]
MLSKHQIATIWVKVEVKTSEIFKISFVLLKNLSGASVFDFSGLLKNVTVISSTLELKGELNGEYANGRRKD